MKNNLFNPLISVTICLNADSPFVDNYNGFISYFSKYFGQHIQIDGDPLKYPQLPDFLEKLHLNNINNIGIRTPSAPTFEQLRFLKKYDIRSILFHHDMQNLAENIHHAKQIGISAEVSVLASKPMLANFHKILNDTRFEGVDLLVVERSIVAEYRQKSVQSLEKWDYYKLLHLIFKNNKNEKKLKIAVSHCPNKILLHSTDTYAQMSGGCSGGVISCAIDWNGNIIPCLPLWQIVLGNICINDFSEIWNNSPLLTQLRNRDNLQGKCAQCEFKMSCGGCRAESYKYCGNLFHEDVSCWKE